MASGILNHDPHYRRAIIQAMTSIGQPRPLPKDLKRLLSCVYENIVDGERKAWLSTPFGLMEIEHVGNYPDRHPDPDGPGSPSIDGLERQS